MMLIMVFIVNVYLIYKIDFLLKQIKFLTLDIRDIKNYLEEINENLLK